MPTGPPDPSPPVEADFGPSHDAITAELLDLSWQFLGVGQVDDGEDLGAAEAGDLHTAHVGEARR
jgi:hypothetical protein